MDATRAAAVIGKDPSSWRGWERGTHSGDPARLELFLLKTGQKELELVDLKGLCPVPA